MGKLITALLLLPIAAHAASYDLVCSAPCTAPDGTTHAAGTVIGRAEWNGHAPYHPTDQNGVAIIPTLDVKQTAPVYAPSVARLSRVTPGAFLARFTATEQSAIQAAALTNASVALGLTMGLATGYVDLTSQTCIQWVQGLVTAGVLTQARATAILTP